MITAIEIENFKGIRDRVRVELKPITLLFGANSSGKSTIIQALLYAREIFERQNLDPRRSIFGGATPDLGGFHSLINKHSPDQPVVLRLHFKLNFNPNPVWFYGDGSDDKSALQNHIIRNTSSCWVGVSVKWNASRGVPQITEYEVGIENEPVARIVATEDDKSTAITYLNFDHLLFCSRITKEFWRASRPLKRRPTSNLLRLYSHALGVPESSERNEVNVPLKQASALPLDPRPYWHETLERVREKRPKNKAEREFDKVLTQIVLRPAQCARDLLVKMRHLGPLRRVLPRGYSTDDFSVDERNWADGLAAWGALHQNEEQLLEHVNSWLARLNVGYRLHFTHYSELEDGSPPTSFTQPGSGPQPDRAASPAMAVLPRRTRLVLVEEGTNIQVLPLDVGVGVSQLIPVIASPFAGPPLDDPDIRLVMIEQPELHIHPALQTELGDLFIKSALGDRWNTFILETHSEHLILRVLRRIRETSANELPAGMTPITPDQVAVLYVQSGKNGAQVVHIPVNADGEFDRPWPEGFFAERARELF